MTVLFANGKVTIDPQYKPQLLDLAQKAKTINGYVIQVKGYASAVGSAALNQKLSTERADNVTDFLEQQGGIPLTNILAPGAMGTSKQVAPDTDGGRSGRESARGGEDSAEQRHRRHLEKRGRQAKRKTRRIRITSKDNGQQSSTNTLLRRQRIVKEIT